jgi:hypothetical protein
VDIKIVGTVTDENGLDEIEEIMKVFAYEQRMKDSMSLIPIQPQTKKVKQLDETITRANKKFIQNAQPHILVKGLC